MVAFFVKLMCDKSLKVLQTESLMFKKIKQLIVTYNEVVAIGKRGQLADWEWQNVWNQLRQFI